MPRSAPLPRRLRRRSAALVFAAALATLSACGGSDDGEDRAASPTSSSAASSSAAEDGESSSSSAPADEGGGALTVTGVNFALEMESTELAAGEYEIEFANQGEASHDLRVEKDGEDVAQSEVIPPGETTTFTVTLESGEYVFYCSVGTHRGMGMEQAVTVT